MHRDNPRFTELAFSDLQKRNGGLQFNIADFEPNGLTDTNAGARH
jgi:hypothetical protein